MLVFEEPFFGDGFPLFYGGFAEEPAGGCVVVVEELCFDGGGAGGGEMVFDFFF